MRKVLILSVILATAWLAPSVAQAIPTQMNISGDGQWGDFTGTFAYDGVDTVAISLTNTSAAANGGFITGFAFNIPSPASVQSTFFVASNPAFLLIGGPPGNFSNDVDADPYGNFDIGAALGGSFLGGGSPNSGIGVGSNATFSFKLGGPGFAGLTAGAFLSTLSAPQGGQTPENFIVRFKGFANGQSDKVPDGGVSPIPEPATALLLGLGLATLSASRRRSRRP